VSLFTLLQVLLEKLFSPELEDRAQLILVEGVALLVGVLLVASVLKNGPSRCVHPLDHEVVQHHLLFGTLNDFLLHRILCDKPVYIDLLLLSNSVSSGLCLQVILRIPVRVKDDNCVGRGQVDP